MSLDQVFTPSLATSPDEAVSDQALTEATNSGDDVIDTIVVIPHPPDLPLSHLKRRVSTAMASAVSAVSAVVVVSAVAGALRRA